MAAKIDNSLRGMIGRASAGVLAVASGSYGNAQTLHAPVLVLNASYEPIIPRNELSIFAAILNS